MYCMFLCVCEWVYHMCAMCLTMYIFLSRFSLLKWILFWNEPVCVCVCLHTLSMYILMYAPVIRYDFHSQVGERVFRSYWHEFIWYAFFFSSLISLTHCWLVFYLLIWGLFVCLFIRLREVTSLLFFSLCVFDYLFINFNRK